MPVYRPILFYSISDSIQERPLLVRDETQSWGWTALSIYHTQYTALTWFVLPCYTSKAHSTRLHVKVQVFLIHPQLWG